MEVEGYNLRFSPAKNRTPPENSRALATQKREEPPMSAWRTVKLRLFGVSGCQSGLDSSLWIDEDQQEYGRRLRDGFLAEE